MRRLLAACAASLVLYAVVFGLLLGRPLAYGFLERQIDDKLARAQTIAGPKLVILAGSNAPYSHRCETIEKMLALPCVNGGVAVGIGLDYLFARWSLVLHRGDVVYLPMEEAQYTITRAGTRVGPDAAIMLLHDRATLAGLPPDRWLSALFSFDLRGALMAVVETSLVHLRFNPGMRDATVGWNNAWGDHVGHTLALAAPNRAPLAEAAPYRAPSAAIAAGYGTRLIAAFARQMAARGVRVIGGLPTGFADIPITPEAIAAIRAVYDGNGGGFIALANNSLYPRVDFFDTPEHLNEPCQIRHSVALAAALAAALGRTPRPPAASDIAAAAACPDPMARAPALAYDPPNMHPMHTMFGQEEER